MDKSVGFIILAAVVVLIGLSFWSQVGTNISTLAELQTSPANVSFVPANNGTAKELTMCGQKVDTIAIWNGTNNLVSATNYTTTQAVGADGFISSFLTTTGSSLYNGVTLKVTCTYQAKGYITDSAGRGVARLIAIFLALLIMASVISPDLRKVWDGVQ